MTLQRVGTSVPVSSVTHQTRNTCNNMNMMLGVQWTMDSKAYRFLIFMGPPCPKISDCIVQKLHKQATHVQSFHGTVPDNVVAHAWNVPADDNVRVNGDIFSPYSAIIELASSAFSAMYAIPVMFRALDGVVLQANGVGAVLFNRSVAPGRGTPLAAPIWRDYLLIRRGGGVWGGRRLGG